MRLEPQATKEMIDKEQDEELKLRYSIIAAKISFRRALSGFFGIKKRLLVKFFVLA